MDLKHTAFLIAWAMPLVAAAQTSGNQKKLAPPLIDHVVEYASPSGVHRKTIAYSQGVYLSRNMVTLGEQTVRGTHRYDLNLGMIDAAVRTHSTSVPDKDSPVEQHKSPMKLTDWVAYSFRYLVPQSAGTEVYAGETCTRYTFITDIDLAIKDGIVRTGPLSKSDKNQQLLGEVVGALITPRADREAEYFSPTDIRDYRSKRYDAACVTADGIVLARGTPQQYDLIATKVERRRLTPAELTVTVVP